ncbi:hypothetical protein GPECTOR_1g666 [Gonium pectorale]|uniref:Uncharacterized protein n=1 Tax=Gonium pectorale TaxID=33097 RepID=A0A150H3M1_GONPE|nr:hypothetical protein GPECTOR_1g666 [Gonium pectorale]|eukprot:KXZ56739.1 hypothetical protein GPECTOR_1g666 [Gonium pectorale]
MRTTPNSNPVTTSLQSSPAETADTKGAAAAAAAIGIETENGIGIGAGTGRTTAAGLAEIVTGGGSMIRAGSGTAAGVTGSVITRAERAGRRHHHRSDQEQDTEAERDGGRRSRSAEADDSCGGGGVSGGWRKSRMPPSNTVHVRNIPEDRDELELRQLLEGFPNLQSVKLVRCRTTGLSRGAAYVEFASEADAAVLMETKARYSLTLGGQMLRLEYAQSLPAAAGPHPAADWICDMCAAVNFARRTECHKCSTARPANPQRAAAELHAPSAILKVSNLEPQVTDEDLRSLFLAHVSVRDVRLVLDKYTGLPRGLAFVEMFSIGEAARALGLLQGAVPAGGSQPMRLCYARDKFGGAGTAPTGTAAGADALEAAQAMSAYSSWEPKAFDAKALDGEAVHGAAQQAAQQTATEAGTGQAGPSSAAAGQASGSQAQPSQSQAPAGFMYDPASGYWYDAASGYYYDANTQLYYHRSTNQWYSYDHATGQYAAVGGGAAGNASHADAGGSAAGGGGASVAAEQGPQLAVAAAAAATTSGSTGKRAGAVIGAAPVLNAQGLLAAAALAEEKNKAAQRAAQKAKQQQAVAGSAPGALQQALGQVAQAPLASGPAQGPVQGVIHRGKWAQRAQQ